jgi:hypothetical protein
LPNAVVEPLHPKAMACYRLLAKEREWLIGTGAIEGE